MSQQEKHITKAPDGTPIESVGKILSFKGHSWQTYIPVDGLDNRIFEWDICHQELKRTR